MFDINAVYSEEKVSSTLKGENTAQKKLYALGELKKLMPGVPFKLDGISSVSRDHICIDVLHLDDTLNVPGGTSLAQHIYDKYGERAAILTRYLI